MSSFQRKIGYYKHFDICLSVPQVFRSLRLSIPSKFDIRPSVRASTPRFPIFRPYRRSNLMASSIYWPNPTLTIASMMQCNITPSRGCQWLSILFAGPLYHFKMSFLDPNDDINLLNTNPIQHLSPLNDPQRTTDTDTDQKSS